MRCKGTRKSPWQWQKAMTIDDCDPFINNRQHFSGHAR